MALVVLSASTAGCGSGPSPRQEPIAAQAVAALAAPDDGSLFRLLPLGAKLVIALELAQLRSSAWTAEAFVPSGGHPGSEAEVARMNKAIALGYDDQRDVDRIVYGLPVLDSSRPTLVIAQGRFRPDVVAEAFRSRWPDAKVTTRRGVTVLSAGENALAFVTGRTFLSGAPADVESGIDRAFGLGAALEQDPGVGPLWRSLEPRGGEPAARAVLAVDEGVRARLASAVTLPRSVTHLGISMELGQTLELTGLAVTSDRGAAGRLAETWASAARGRSIRLAAAAAGLAPVVDALRIVAEGARVRVAASLGEGERPELIQAIRVLLEALRGR